MENIKNKNCKKYSHKQYRHIWFAIFFVLTIILTVISISAGILSLKMNGNDNVMIYLDPDAADSFSNLVRDYSNVFINVIIAVGVAVITIDSTIFVFSKTALDRINDENKYISNVVKTHKETTIKLLAKICGISLSIIFVSILWHLALSFCYNVYSYIFYISIATLFAGALTCITASINFLMRCINNEKYLRLIIFDKQQELEKQLDQCLPISSSEKRLQSIGDWQSWLEDNYLKDAKKACNKMRTTEFINLFQIAEKLLISVDNNSSDEDPSRLVDIISSFSERESILKYSTDVDERELKERYYFNKTGNTISVFDSIRNIEQQINFYRSENNHTKFFLHTEKLYLILKDYCNLLISEKYTRKNTLLCEEIIRPNTENDCLANQEQKIEKIMDLPRFAEAYYFFYLRILSIFISSVYISNLSFNDSSLNYANLYNSTLEKISLIGATFYRTVVSNTTFNEIIMDISKYEDIDFYSSTLINSSMNNSTLEQVRFERAVVQAGGFDSCDFTTCKFYNSDFTNCSFNNTIFIDSEFFNVSFINSKFRDISVKGGCFDSCSFEGSELSKWDIEGDMSLVSCDFSKSTWSEMAINNWDLSESVFSKAILAGTVFNYATMNSADFSDCSLAETEIEKSKMAGCNLKRASLFKAKLTEVDLSMADLSNANAVQAKFLYKCSLENTNCDDADFSGAEFDDAVLNSARLYNCSFTNSKLNQTKCLYLLADKMQFTFAECNDCDFSYSSLSDSNLTKSSFSSCKFIGADLSSTNETETKFENCILKNTDFSDTRFVNAEFFGESPDHPMIIVNCDFTDCKFESVSFRNVIFVNCIFNDCVMIKCKNTDGNFITKCNAEGLFGSDSRSITFFNKKLIIDEDSDRLNKKNKRLIETNRKRSTRHYHHRIHRNR